MRNILLAIIALFSGALLACNKQELEISVKPVETVEMTVVAEGAGTKTALNGESIVWSGSEKLKVIEAVTGGDDDGKFSYKNSSEGIPSNGGAKMTFNVSLNEHTGATGFQYVALYPSTSFEAVTSFNNIAVNTLDTQNPSDSSYDPAADMLISQVSATSATQPTTINMAFARKVAIGQMTIKNLGSDETITSITFSAEKKNGENYDNVLLAGRSKVDFTTSTVSYGSNIKKYSISLDYEGDSVTLNNAAGAPTYFVCYPFSLAADDKFTVVVETATKRFTRTVILSGLQTLEFTPGDVSRFSVNMYGIEGVTKAVSLHYAELTKEEVYATGITSQTYKSLDIEKFYGDKWAGNINFYNDGFGLRNSASTNDSYVKLPDFAQKINTVTIELSKALDANNDPSKTTFLSLETAANFNSKSIASLDRVENQMTYVFDVSADNIHTAFLRSTNAAAYIKKVTVTTDKADTRSQLAPPTNVTAALSETNDISVSWTKATNAVGYEIVCTPESGVTVTTEVGDVASYKVEGLANNTTYTITMYSIPDYYVNTKSNPAESNPATITTTKGASYILDGTTTGGSSGYTTESDITQDGILWKVTGNTTMSPWRIGGNNGAFERTVYNTSKISDNIAAVKIDHGAASTITVNSLTLIVSKNADFSDPVSTLTPSFSANNEITVERPAGKDWSECFYKLVYNVSISVNSNRFVELKKISFYE